jgi:tRNA(Ile)-lysidine synthase
MNADPRFDRVYLRETIWPLIERRWPGAAAALSRTALHVAEAQGLLEDLADADLSGCSDGRTLSVAALRGLQPGRRVNALRRWLAQAGAPMPPSARLHEGLRQLLEAAPDHVPVCCWDEIALRRYRDRVHLTAAHPPHIDVVRHWDYRAAEVLELGPGLGRLRVVERGGGLAPERLPGRLTVRRRSGGEVLRPDAEAATQTVQHLCQRLGVLPWMRDALPFIFAGADLIAVGDLWLAATHAARGEGVGLAFSWEGAPNIV